jgi:hypothetical protein
MVSPSERKKGAQAQNDPGESNDPQKSDRDGYQAHIWTSLNQIFERLGKMDQKIDQLAVDQGKLKESVEKHDKIIMRVGFTVAGAIAVIAALWFIYDKFLKDRIIIT